MKCYMCDKELIEGKEKGFVCICDKCLKVMEKSEARMVGMIDRLRKVATGIDDYDVMKDKT